MKGGVTVGAANMVDVIARGSTGEVSEGTSQHGRCWRRDVDGGVVEGGTAGELPMVNDG